MNIRQLLKSLHHVTKNPSSVKTHAEFVKELEEKRMWKKNHPWKHLWRQIKWWSCKYWIASFITFLGYFDEDTPWRKSLWNYIYLENAVFGFFYKVYSAVDTFCYKVRKIYLWSKVLWNNHDWDWTAMWTVLQYQLERLADAIGNGHHSNCRCDASEIQYALILLYRISRFDYGDQCPYEKQAKSMVENQKDHMEVEYQKVKLYQEDIMKMWDFISKFHRNWWD